MDRLAPTNTHDGVAWQEWRQMSCDANRSHSRSAAPVRDRERLMQVQVADVSPNRRRARQPDLRVHVGAVHVHLSAILMDDIRHICDVVHENGGQVYMDGANMN